MERDLTTPADRVEEKSDEAVATASEVTDPQVVQHLATGFSLTQGVPGRYDSLPYHQLGGAGLERLCYSLIQAQGGVPRYFGNPGQEQYGIDLVVSDGAECAVYQCKNVNAFNRRNMAEALQLFEAKWLGHPKLPSPTKFVLCCPLPLRETKMNKEWTILEREFYERAGVRIEVWDKEFLDATLRNLPDVVADLFSDQAAEWFCGLEDWNEDLFRPVRFGVGEPTVTRYLEKKDAEQIYLDPSLSEEFARRLESYGSLLILGLPGSGKTITGLALADSFRHGLYRLFYVNMRRDLSEDVLVRGIRRRLARPTIFLIDDCHWKYEILEGVPDRLREVLARQPGRAFLIYTARTTPTPEGMPRADSGFVEEFKKAEAALEFRPTPELFASITAVTKPDLRELSAERLDRIFTATGRDLFLLDQLLDTIKSPDEIDRLEPEHLFEETLRRYFGQPTVHRPGFMLLTALAQFEIAPAVADFPYDLRREDPKAAAQLLVEADRPLRYFFLHSSAAELVFRALAWNDRTDNHAEVAALKLIEYFKGRPATDLQLPADLSSVLRTRLKLRGDKGEEHLLKSRFLADDRVFALTETFFERLSLDTVALLLNVLETTDAETFKRYRELVQIKVEDGGALESFVAGPPPSQFLNLVINEYPSWFFSLREQFADRGFRQLVGTKELRSLLRFLTTLAKQKDFILDNAVDSARGDEFEGMINRTIAKGRSIATLNLPLLALRTNDPDFLERLERKIGAQRYLRLIVSSGTVFELFRVLQCSTPFMTSELIDALDEEIIDKLIEKTIDRGRSIGTLSFTLRELKKSAPDKLAKLEKKIGVERWWKLIIANGNMGVVARLLQRMDDPFKREMDKASLGLKVNDWEGLLLRGDLNDLAASIRWRVQTARPFTPELIESLGPTFEKLIHAANWATLNSSIYHLSEALDSPLKGYLQSVIDKRLSETEITSLRFDTFVEAAGCIGSLGQMPSKRDEVVRSLFNILPGEDRWCRDASFIRAARDPLFILAISQSRPEDDERMLGLCNNVNVASLFARSKSLDILLYLWNVYSLWFKHEKVVKREAGATFAAFIEPEIRVRVNHVLNNRLRSRADQAERENLVGLCGFLYASGLARFSVGKMDKAAWISRLPPFDEFLAKVEVMKSFLVASFFLIGLGWIFDRDIPGPVFSRVMTKASSYEVGTDAFNNLRRLLSARVL